MGRLSEWLGNGPIDLVKQVLDSTGMYLSEEQTKNACLTMLRAYAGKMAENQLYPGVLPFLEHLRQHQITLGVLSNNPSDLIQTQLDTLNITGFFRYIVGSDTSGTHKPNPNGIYHILRESRIPSERALMVRDSSADVLAAHAARLRCVAVSYGYNHHHSINEEHPDRVVDNLSKLLPNHMETLTLGG